MTLFNVYPRFDITPESGDGVYIYDSEGKKYLDLYGGHGVISVGHSHPYYTSELNKQLNKIGFYSNSIKIPLQDKLAVQLGKLSGYTNHHLFLCNSGAEANENALKLASFHNGKRTVIAFKDSFHGRTSAALNVTDNNKLQAPLNTENFPVIFARMNSKEDVENAFDTADISSVIIEGIQGVGGLDMPTTDFLHFLAEKCKQNNALLILDEIQSGFGRSGHFFAHQKSKIEADIVTIAKGMGNGFPVAGVLIHPKIKSKAGMLGTTFGGNYLACVAANAVLEIIKNEKLQERVMEVSTYLKEELEQIPSIKKIKGEGLMLGLEFDFAISELRKDLLYKHFVFTGASANPNLLRILPPLTIRISEITPFIHALKTALK